MKFYHVESAQIEQVGYDPQTETLRVKFHSKGQPNVYQYPNVPKFVVCEMLFSPSVGKYFNANIRDKFSFERVDPDRIPVAPVEEPPQPQRTTVPEAFR